MSAGQQIDYELLAQDAMRGVVREVLRRVAADGLPGDHHFYIAFNMRAPGVSVSKRLREKYPEEMTIVLQHRFWDLIVDDDRFEVKLTFDAIPERLSIPFKAIKVFLDPSVQYGLQFGEAEVGEPLPASKADRARASASALSDAEHPAHHDADDAEAQPPARPVAERRRPQRKPRAERAAETPPAAPAAHEPAVPALPAAAGPVEPKARPREADAVKPEASPAAAETAPPAPAAAADTKVVKLENYFRNKSK